MGRVYERCRICTEELAEKWRELKRLRRAGPLPDESPSRYENEPWYPAYKAARDAALAKREKRERGIGWTHA